MRGNVGVGMVAMVVAVLGAAGLGGLHAQQATAPLGVGQADRARVLEALGRGDVAGAEKVMLSLQAQLPAAPPPSEIQGGSVFYEELKSCGLYTQSTRLECVIEIKQRNGYNGPVGAFGSVEHVYFCIDWNNNGTFTQLESVGQGSVQMHDEASNARPPWFYAVYRDFDPFGGFRTSNGGATAATVTNAPTLRVQATLSWFTAPTGCNFHPVWGNTIVFPVRLDPIR